MKGMVGTDISHLQIERNGPINVLVVEDDYYYYRQMCHLLSVHHEANFELTRTESLAESLKYLATWAPHVILLDLNLGDSNGVETLVAVQSCNPRIPVIVLTGADAQELGIRSIAKGASDFLIKQKVSANSIVRCIYYAIERRKAEESRLRLQAIQDFTAALAHDLQVPLIGANQVLDALLTSRKEQLSPLQSQLLVSLKESNLSQLKIVQKLIEIYKYESGERTLSKQQIDMKDVLVQAVSHAEEFFKAKEVVIFKKIAPDLKAILADPDAMLSLVRSLLENAIKFSSPGAEVTIEVENIGSDICLRVKNFGETISPEDQLHMFDRFWQGVRGKKYVANTGLGLYLCQRILSFHDGRISCSSDVDKGTTFTVTLPATDNVE